MILSDMKMIKRFPVMVLLFLTTPIMVNAGNKNYIAGFEIGVTYGRLLQLPKESLRISGDDEFLLSWSFIVKGGYKIKRNNLLGELFYKEHYTKDNDRTGFKKDLLQLFFIDDCELMQIRRVGFSGIVGYNAYIFKTSSIQDKSRTYRNSGYAPVIGFRTSIKLKKYNAMTSDNRRISSAICDITYKYSDAVHPLHIMKLSILFGVSENRYGTINIRYLLHKELYRVIVLTFGGYGFIG